MLSIANAAALRGLKCGTFYLLRVVKFSQNSGSCRRIEITYIAHIYIELYIYVYIYGTCLLYCQNARWARVSWTVCLELQPPVQCLKVPHPPPVGVVVVVTICLSVCLANIPAFSSPDLAVFYVKYCTKAYCRLWAT